MRCGAFSPDASSYSTVYSPGGRVDAIVDGNGNRTDFTYDSVGQRIRTTLPEVFVAATGVSRRPETLDEWDAAGRLVANVNANGTRTAHAYDAAARRVRTIYADGTTRQERHDPLGESSSARMKPGG